MHRTLIPALLLAAAGAAPEGPGADLAAEARAFLADYNQRYVELYTAAQEAEWAANTYIKEGDDTNRKRFEEASEALARYTSSTSSTPTSPKLPKAAISGAARRAGAR